MGVFVATMLLGVDLRRLVHEPGSVQRVRLREHAVVGRLRVIAAFVAFGGEFVVVGGRTVVLGGEPVRRDGGMFSH
jgi:hypothetical protein